MNIQKKGDSVMKACRPYVLSLIVLLTLTFFITGISHAQTVPDLTKWVNTWFKITLTSNVYHFSDIGVKPNPPYRVIETGSPAYMKITSWDPGTGILQANVYIRDGGVYDPNVFETLSINYFAGDALKFVCSSFVDTGPTQNGFVLFFRGKVDAKGNFILGGETLLKSLGGYYLEIDDVPGSTERWAGSAVLNGKMIPASKVPPVLLP